MKHVPCKTFSMCVSDVQLKNSNDKIVLKHTEKENISRNKYFLKIGQFYNQLNLLKFKY